MGSGGLSCLGERLSCPEKMPTGSRWRVSGSDGKGSGPDGKESSPDGKRSGPDGTQSVQQTGGEM